MSISQQAKNQHLLWRAGFGVNTETIKGIAGVPHKVLYETLQTASDKQPDYIDVADNSLKGLVMGLQQAGEVQQLQKSGDMQMLKPADKDQRKEFRKESALDIRSLNTTWLDKMAIDDAQLREKMSLFWHGHFACRNLNIFFQQLLLQEIRTNALSNFGDLLKGVSKSAAMLNFLNNQQNKKGHPNENFAREVMELFTMGRGNYTEQDIKEAARAFTGWGSRFNGEFVFRPFVHDTDQKTFLGKRGNYNGDDILNIILEQPQTATFITQKIYRFFVNDVVDADIINSLSKSFYHSDYNISQLMKNIFNSDWFYDEKNIGCHIKSPVEFLAGMRRLLSMQFDDAHVEMVLQRALGQILFYPPNVAGWPGGQTWIDSSTLMLRLRVPQLVKDDQTVYVVPKPDDDVQMGMKDIDLVNKNGVSKGAMQLNATVNWDAYIQQFADVKDEQLYETISAIVLQTNKNNIDKGVIESNVKSDKREDYIKNATIALMATPEYQLC